MPVIIDVDDSVIVNSNNLSDAPAVRIAADRVRFTNEAILTSTQVGSPALLIEGNGAIIHNAAGARITFSGYPSGPLATTIMGSAFADMIVNDGRIDGLVDLGDGDDEFVQRSSAQSFVRLQGGDDIFRLDNVTTLTQQIVDGGDGYDRYVIGANINTVIYGAASSFEQLEVAVADTIVNLDGFSDFQAILLEAGGRYSIGGSYNPLVQLELNGGWLLFGNSTFGSITGGDDSEIVSVLDTFTGVGTVLGDLDLGGGNDTLILYWTMGPGPDLRGRIDGGDGEDALNIFVTGGQTIDLAAYEGFERLGGSVGSSIVSDMRIIHADAFSRIYAASNGRLVIGDSLASDAFLDLGYRSRVEIEATAMIGMAGYAGLTFFSGISDLYATPDSGNAITLINNGTIAGTVILSSGSDHYDGRDGSEGALYALAGNDSIQMGGGDDYVEGGFGDDEIDGAGGADQLRGGAGADRLTGAEGADTLHGDDGVDHLSGGAGADLMFGGGDGDVLDGGEGADELHGDGGDDLLNGGAGDDNLRGGSGDDELMGGAGRDQLHGGADADRLIGGNGVDRITGDLGEDFLLGGDGDDLLFGGAAADIFAIESIGESFAFRRSDGVKGKGDVIADFESGIDKIDLSAVDADIGLVGDQAFTFVGTAAFSGRSGELRIDDFGTRVLLSGDVDGDGQADFVITINSGLPPPPMPLPTLVAADLIL